MCRQCHKRYQILLYIERQNQSTNDKGSATNDPPADARGNTTADVNTYSSFKGKPINHIPLATAIVEVQNILVIRSMQSIVRQCFSITFNYREMCTTYEVIQDADTYTNERHKQCQHKDISQCINTFKVEAYRLAYNP